MTRSAPPGSAPRIIGKISDTSAPDGPEGVDSEG